MHFERFEKLKLVDDWTTNQQAILHAATNHSFVKFLKSV